MNELHFSEEQLGNIQVLGQSLFSQDASDPRSWNYKRQLIRPKISWWRIGLFATLVIGGAFGLYYLFRALGLPAIWALWLSLACGVLAVLLCLKRILICIVRIYQRFAPASIRNKCRFEPSCSHYMILSLQKYGLRKGLGKGIDRLKRCSVQDGGFDDP